MNKTLERVKDRLRHWYGLAEVRHIASGKAWYREAHEFAVGLSETYDIPLYKVVGVIAAISPSVYWDQNKRQAEKLCQAYADGGPLEDVVVTTYGRQAVKARQILRDAQHGIHVNEMLGKRAFKTKSFYWNILRYPDSLAVTIDQHIISAAGFENRWVQGSKWCYNLLADAIRELAVELNLKPYELQAIIWITYKEIVDTKDLPF